MVGGGSRSGLWHGPRSSRVLGTRMCLLTCKKAKPSMIIQIDHLILKSVNVRKSAKQKALRQRRGLRWTYLTPTGDVGSVCHVGSRWEATLNVMGSTLSPLGEDSPLGDLVLPTSLVGVLAGGGSGRSGPIPGLVDSPSQGRQVAHRLDGPVWSDQRAVTWSRQHVKTTIQVITY